MHNSEESPAGRVVDVGLAPALKGEASLQVALDAVMDAVPLVLRLHGDLDLAIRWKKTEGVLCETPLACRALPRALHRRRR